MKYLTEFLLEIIEDADDNSDNENHVLFDWSTPESKEEMLDIAKEFNLEDSEIAIIESSIGAILNVDNKDTKTFDSVDHLNDAWNEIIANDEDLEDSDNSELED